MTYGALDYSNPMSNARKAAFKRLDEKWHKQKADEAAIEAEALEKAAEAEIGALGDKGQHPKVE